MAELTGGKKAKKSVKTFKLFDLPRELRDRVYRLALVTGLVDIDPVVCASDDDDDETRALHPEPKYRTTYISMGKLMTYKLATPRSCNCRTCFIEPEPQLQLFYVSRTVYEEAREIFYKENEFNTILSSGLGCNAFLKDRQYALPMIRKFSFDVPVHTADFSYGGWTNKHYIALFKTIKEKSGIRSLTLNIHGLVPKVDGEKWICPCEKAQIHPLVALGQAMGIPGVPPTNSKRLHIREWNLFKCLTTITDLHRLAINVDFCYHMTDQGEPSDEIFEHNHIRGFVGYMRSKMLKKGEALGTTQIHGYCRVHDEVEDKRYRFHSDDDEYGNSHLQLFRNSPHQNARHDHVDSGSEPDGTDRSDYGDLSDDWEDETDDDDATSTNSDMPSLEDIGNEDAMLSQPNDDDVD